MILFTADWHLKLGQKNVPVEWAKKRYRSFFEQINGLEKECNMHIIGGDLFDRIPTMEELELYFEWVKYASVPTIIFDEIDSGVSGKVANQIGIMMHSMSDSNQILAITHIPQVASRGDKHIKIFKEVVESVTHTNLKELTNEEREIEIASMLSGKKMTSSAIKHARELLE